MKNTSNSHRVPSRPASRNHRSLRAVGVRALGLDSWESGRVWGRSADVTGSHRYMIVSGTVTFDAMSEPVGPGHLVALPPGVTRRRRAATAVQAIFVTAIRFGRTPASTRVSNAVALKLAALDQLVVDARLSHPSMAAEATCGVLMAHVLGPLAGTVASGHDRLRLDALWRAVGAEPHHPWTTALLAERACAVRPGTCTDCVQSTRVQRQCEW